MSGRQGPAAEEDRDRSAEQEPHRASGRSAADRPTTGEYVLGGLGVALVVALLVFLGYQGLVVRDGGARLSTTVSGITETADGWEVAFEVGNDGGEAAEEVQVTGTVTTADGTTESASAVLARIPADSTRAGTLLFTTDPGRGQLEVRPEGYAEP